MSEAPLSPEQREFLAEMRRREAEHVQAARSAFPAPADLDGLGSFGADDPAVHAGFRNAPMSDETPDPDEPAQTEPRQGNA